MRVPIYLKGIRNVTQGPTIDEAKQPKGTRKVYKKLLNK